MSLLKPHISKIKDEGERNLTSLKATTKTQIFYPNDLVYIRNFSQREEQWLERRTVKQLSPMIYLIQLKGITVILKTCRPRKVLTNNRSR